jgi:hypothetical protein
VGTSHAAPSPTTVKWGAVIGSLKNSDRTASTVLSATVSATLPLLPLGYTTIPAVYAAYESFKFVADVQEKGLEEAVEKRAIQISFEFLIPSVSNGLWKIAAFKMGPEFINTPFGKLAEIAFKKTINSILSKGEVIGGKQPERAIEENIKVFMITRGKEGFLSQYFANYLFELSEYYLHSQGKEGENAGYLYYVDFESKRVRTPKQLEDFRNDLRKLCAEHAFSIIKEVKESGLIDQLGVDPSVEPEAARQVAESIDAILKKLGKEGL